MVFNFPHIAKTLRSKLKELKNENMVFRRLMIRNLYYLRDMSDDIINEIICNLQVQRYAKGSIILKNGDASDRLLFVRHGEVDVKVTNQVSQAVEVTEKNELLFDVLNTVSTFICD
jgi:signal-transduction protein with cAMP-binding, CBS, and nucleotidyltransferase domain